MRRDPFQGIADPIRREILDIISTKSLSVNDVAEHFEISRQAVSKQIKILNECGLVTIQKKGRERYISITPKSLVPAFMWIDKLQKQWEERIDSFEQYVDRLKKENNDT